MKVKLMKKSGILVFMLASLLMGVWANPPTIVNASAPAPNDRDTDCIVRFYGLLTQQAEPTAEDEVQIFSDTQPWIDMLKKKNQLPDGKSTLISWFRANKFLFIPGHMRTAREIYISSGFQFVATAEGFRTAMGNNNATVIAYFTNDRTLPNDQQKMKAITFHLTKGKLDADSPRPDGFGTPGILPLWEN